MSISISPVQRYWKTVSIIILAAFLMGAILVLMPRKSATVLENTEFIIEKGQSLEETARSLDERGLIINRFLFVAYAILSGHERDFKAGRYMIAEPNSIRKLIFVFSHGLSEPEDIVVTIPEGSNVADIDKMLAKAGLIERGEFLNEALQYDGYLFPDTYRFAQNQKSNIKNQNGGNGEVQPLKYQEVEPLNFRVQEIIQKMRENFEAKITAVDNLSELNSDRLGRMIIIASILEKEVKTEQDMKLVSGIIEKRLQLGMPLEIDATVAYGVCYQKFLLGEYCDVSLANIVDNIPIDLAYNTYKRKGLPAGPISNPGLMAINAALNPQPSDYLYYLSAKDGTTIFSKTATEHARARQKYLR